jgi:EAL domain-containing protein (putative c-di-GMP-specific phosphodiesterase class I)
VQCTVCEQRSWHPLHALDHEMTRIKINQSFIRGLPDDSKLVAIVRSLIAMAHNVGLIVTAAGVETADEGSTFENWRLTGNQ